MKTLAEYAFPAEATAMVEPVSGAFERSSSDQGEIALAKLVLRVLDELDARQLTADLAGQAFVLLDV